MGEIFLLGPGRTGGGGVFRDIRELRPGELAHFDREGLRVGAYWSLKAGEHTDNIQQAVEKTRFLIRDTVVRQLVSDVPLCCFLSGGLDSSIITKLAADAYAEGGLGKLATYSVDYTDNHRFFTQNSFQPNEDSHYIQLMSGFAGSEHHEVILNNEALAAALDEATLARDLPGMADVDSSLLLFCREIKKNFTVSVSGECADEIFGGYPWYHRPEILFSEGFPWSRSLELRKSLLRPGVLLPDPEDYVYQRYRQTVDATDSLPTDSVLDKRMREMFMLNFHWFMQVLLDRKDRMSMYSGLEVRVPFCDHRLVEYAYNMPWSVKSLNGREKGIVREAMKGLLPEEILLRKKSPYPKTHNPVYADLVKQRLLAILEDPNAPLSQLVDRNAVLALAARTDDLAEPWYGQLMRLPQIFAYLLQVDCWLRRYRVSF
jgi:asparagine synthase (glutamine-hydrolysing)